MLRCVCQTPSLVMSANDARQYTLDAKWKGKRRAVPNAEPALVKQAGVETDLVAGCLVHWADRAARKVPGSDLLHH
jgi:hypothetical protein